MGDGARLGVLIGEDDPLVCSALAELVNSEPDFELVGIAQDAGETIRLAAATRPDVVLVDVRMPGGGGVTATRGIRRRSPGSKVIALSGQSDRATVLQMLEAGVVGYLLKGGALDEIVEAIKRAPDGDGCLSIGVTGGVIDELAGQLHLRVRDQKERALIERRIRKHLEDESSLTMVFQPIVGLDDGETAGAEALARFAGPPHRAPSLWFADAAAVGLRDELELAAAQKAIEALPELPPGTYLTINVSPATLLRAEFFELLSDPERSRLVVEITEHAPIENYSRLSDILDRLRSDGTRLAIDDAGAGYASLRHILELRPDLIKLDISLISNIDGDQSKQALAAGLISFADKCGAIIVAEGIERAAEVETLVELGVSYGQGYLLGRPGPLPLQPTPTEALRTVRTVAVARA